jgi:hypothetical protein
MLKRLTIVLALTVMVLFIAHPGRQLAHGVLMTPDEVTTANAAVNTEGKNGGNAFVRVISAPFKAIGKLFGAGKNDNKPRRSPKKTSRSLRPQGQFALLTRRWYLALRAWE